MLICPKCRKRFHGGQFCPHDGTSLVDDADRDRSGEVIGGRYRMLRQGRRRRHGISV